MKKIVFLFIMMLCYLTSMGQGFKLSRFYELREANAPAALKTQLAQVRQQIASNNLSYVVGYTSKAMLPISQITGEKITTASQELQLREVVRASQLSMAKVIKANPALSKRVISGLYVYGTPTQSKLDLRMGGLVTGVRDQGPYLSCWSFGAMAAYEGNFKATNTAAINASEQYVINCSHAGTSASGGLAFEVFRWMVDNNKNVADEGALGYTGPDGTCPGATPASDYYAVAWGIVDPSGDPSKIPTVDQIKNAICRYGVISASVYATDNFKIYAGGPFYEFPSNYSSPSSNHAIAIIGWDDSIQCWLIKNSWGTDWGDVCDYGTERGYMWIKYNSNNVGRRAAYVLAKKR